MSSDQKRVNLLYFLSFFLASCISYLLNKKVHFYSGFMTMMIAFLLQNDAQALLNDHCLLVWYTSLTSIVI